MASPDGRDGSLRIYQDARIYLTTLAAGEHVTHNLDRGRHAWIQVLRGGVQLNGRDLSVSDGAAISEEASLVVSAAQLSEVMLFDLP